MVRGGTVESKRNPKKRTKSRDQGSDDSDEDYVVSDEETDASEDAVGELEGSALEDSFDAFVEDENDDEEEEEEEDEDYDGNGADGADDDDDDGMNEEEEEEEEDKDMKKVVNSKSKPISGSSRQRKAGNSISLKKVSDSFEEDDEEYDVNEEDDEEDDDEFAPDEDDYLDDEEDSVAKKSYRSKVNTARRKLGRRGMRRKVSRGHKKSKKSSTSRNPSRQMGRKRHVVQKKPKSAGGHDDSDNEDDVDFVGRHNVWREKRKSSWGRRKRRYVASSDSDFMSIGSSGCDYTISEEEREQVREANEYCGNLNPSLRNSLSSKRLKKGGCFTLRSSSISNGTRENPDPDQQTKPSGIKGKEKVEEVNIVKQTCGICLSEEDKRRVRGRLDCCSHYFCFKCVSEWSKVETRCPLCKQRFRAISKPARSTAGIDLRDVVIQVPERDQVYQPSEEEIRGYLDPYENVICTECQQGGDDGLMLLCDVCDSPAHTYCVGLGREVPEGNWYCDGCRPAAFGSSSSPGQDALPNQRTTSMSLSSRLSPTANAVESFDLNVAPSPHPSYNLGYGNIPSPRFPSGFSQATPPLSGAGAPTLSGRRWLFRQIQQMRSGNRPSPVAVRADGTTSASLRFGQINYSIDHCRQMGSHHQAQETREPYANLFEENGLENQSPLVRSRDSFDLAAGHLRRQAVNDHDLAFIPPTPCTSGRALLDERAGMSSTIVPDQHHQSSSRSSLSSDGAASPYAGREDSHFRIAKEELQSMVKSHLKSLSREIGLGQGEFKEIARCSTHTILAACGLEHRRSEAYTVPPPSGCSHIDKIATGQTSLMRGVCSTCFDVFVREVTQNIMNKRRPSHWLSLGL
ncbi:hypothetical protein BT93_H3288 [Corymbia citriodora subsp. variegata]|nr:hypothetical protein BT93_H3288 [Corymbia citriodora subsp. variegata]KAF8018352.1 hypothetical protein BT93_H3288 [Corymbia citriodora subsp. variegata]